MDGTTDGWKYKMNECMECNGRIESDKQKDRWMERWIIRMNGRITGNIEWMDGWNNG